VFDYLHFHFSFSRTCIPGTRPAVYVDGNEMIKVLHVGDAEFSNQDYSVFLKLISNIMKSVRLMPKELLEQHRLFYDTGQLDIMVAYGLYIVVCLRCSSAQQNKTTSPLDGRGMWTRI